MYIYEMHFHTEPCSGGGDKIKKQIEVMKERGYTGGFLTDHFYSGDTRIDRTLSWDAFVDEYEKAYEKGVAYGREHDFDLFFGIEEHIGNGLEILVYGITPDLLRQHPELRAGKLDDYIKIVHEAGGLIFQSHPYRERYYIVTPGPIDRLDEIDGIEVYNAANLPEENERAARLAEEKGVRYLHTAEVLKNKSGALDERYASADGVTLNEAGYAAMLQYLRTHGYKAIVKEADSIETNE